MRQRWITDWTPSERWPHYTRANAGEVVPTPASPLSVTFTWDNGLCQGWRDGYIRIGAFSADEWDNARPEACGFFGGYMYINLSNVRMQGVRNPAVTVEQLDLAFFGDHPDVPPYVPDPGDERPDLVPGIAKHSEWLVSTTSWPEIDQEKAATIALRADRPALGGLDDAGLLERARDVQRMLVKLFESHTISSSGSALAPAILNAIGGVIGDPTIPMRLLVGIGEVDSVEPSLRIWDLSRQVRASAELGSAFDAGLEGLLDRLESSNSSEATAFLEAWRQFVATCGTRGPNEYEISAETWETAPSLALASLDRARLQSDDESPALRLQRSVADRDLLEVDVRAKLAEIGNDELTAQFEAALVAASQMMFRERTKTNLIRAIHECRMVFRELGRRHAEAGHLVEAAHVFQLLDGELEAFVADPTTFRDELAERATDWAALWGLEPPFIIRDGNVPPLGQWAKRADAKSTASLAGTVLQGVSGCPGVVQGRARIILDIGDPADLEPGDILVAPLTDPGWAPLFLAAAGVVVEVGGQISHAVIVSRELGLPCVVSATGATTAIPDGSTIEVDGNTGRVTLLSVPA